MSSRRLVSPDLVVSLPLFPLPEPSKHPITTPPAQEVVSTSQEALALFRLPTLAVSLLPFASWELRVFRVEETALAATAPEHHHHHRVSKGSPKGKEREIEHVEHVEVVERWYAEVEWTLRIASPLAPAGSEDDKTDQPPLFESITAPRKVELVFTSRPHVHSTPTTPLRGGERRLHSPASRSSRSGSSGDDEGREREIGATSSAHLVEKVAAEEHALELSFVRYSVPDFSVPFLPPSGPLHDAALALPAWLVPLAWSLVKLVGLDQQLRLDVPKQADAPLVHGAKRKHDSPSLRGPSMKRRKHRATPLASQSAAVATEAEAAYHSEGGVAASGHARPFAHHSPPRPPHPHPHPHLTRRRRWSASTTSASSSSATLRASPEPAPAPGPWTPSPPAALLTALELASAVWASLGAAWAEWTVLLWAIRQAVLFVTELVEEGWGVAKEVLLQSVDGDGSRPASEQGSEGGSSEVSAWRSRKSAMSSGNGCGVSFSLSRAERRKAGAWLADEQGLGETHSHKRESLLHRHVTFSSDSPPAPAPVLPSPPSTPTLSGDSTPPGELEPSASNEPSEERPDAASALALTQLHARVSREAAAEARERAPELAQEYEDPSRAREPDGALVGVHYRAGIEAAHVAQERSTSGREAAAVRALDAELEGQRRVRVEAEEERVLQEVDEQARAHRMAGRAAAARGRRMSGSEREMEAVREVEERREEKERETWGEAVDAEVTDAHPAEPVPQLQETYRFPPAAVRPTGPRALSRDDDTPSHSADPSAGRLSPFSALSHSDAAPAAAAPHAPERRLSLADRLAALEPGERRPRQEGLDTPVATPARGGVLGLAIRAPGGEQEEEEEGAGSTTETGASAEALEGKRRFAEALEAAGGARPSISAPQTQTRSLTPPRASRSRLPPSGLDEGRTAAGASATAGRGPSGEGEAGEDGSELVPAVALASVEPSARETSPSRGASPGALHPVPRPTDPLAHTPHRLLRHRDVPHAAHERVGLARRPQPRGPALRAVPTPRARRDAPGAAAHAVAVDEAAQCRAERARPAERLCAGVSPGRDGRRGGRGRAAPAAAGGARARRVAGAGAARAAGGGDDGRGE